MTEEQDLLLSEGKEFKRFYRLSLWWVEHRDALRRLGLGTFIVVDGLVLLFVLWTMTDSFIIRSIEDERQVAQMAAYGQDDLHGYTVARAAEDIVTQDVRLFSIGNGRYDFYASVSNPNTDWWVEFQYAFVFDAGSTTPVQGFLLPGQTKPFVSLALTSQQPAREATIDFKNIVWHRLDHHQIVDYETWQNDHLRLDISNAAFEKETGFEGSIFGRTTFQVFNNTAFHYLDPSFIVLLKRGAAVVGVNKATVVSLGAGEKQDVSLNWFGTLPSVGSVEVIPDINLFNPRVYQRLEGQPGIDIRERNL